MSAYDVYERKSKKRMSRNQKYIDTFKEDLISEGLSQKRVRNHIANVTSYLNWFIIDYRYCESMQEAVREVSGFLSYFIPDKYIGSTKNLIRENGTSLRKFYRCMAKHGYITEDAFRRVSEDISEAIADGGREHRLFVKEFFEDFPA